MVTLNSKSLLPVSFIILGLGISSPGAGQTPQTPSELESLYNCKSIADPSARLDCYDTTVVKLEAAQASGDITTVRKTDIENVKREAFGFKIPSLPALSGLFGSGGSKNALTDADISSPRDKNAKVTSKETRKKAEIKRVVLNIKRTEKFDYNRTRFYFENGQVWEQVTSERVRVPKVRDGNIPTGHIRRASLGSYLMQINGKGGGIRVRRVK